MRRKNRANQRLHEQARYALPRGLLASSSAFFRFSTATRIFLPAYKKPKKRCVLLCIPEEFGKNQ
jgi:hypothetical protein